MPAGCLLSYGTSLTRASGLSSFDWKVCVGFILIHGKNSFLCALEKLHEHISTQKPVPGFT